MGPAFCGQAAETAAGERAWMDCFAPLFWMLGGGLGWGDSACGSWSGGEQPKNPGEGFPARATQRWPGPTRPPAPSIRCWANRRRKSFAKWLGTAGARLDDAAHLVALPVSLALSLPPGQRPGPAGVGNRWMVSSGRAAVTLPPQLPAFSPAGLWPKAAQVCSSRGQYYRGERRLKRCLRRFAGGRSTGVEGSCR